MMSFIPWFKCSYNDTHITLDVSPPGSEVWTDEINWDDIIRICFKTGIFLDSDELYIFIKDRKPSYLIPLDGQGSLDLWQEIIRRGLFDAQMAIDLATTENELRCHPEKND